jgi:spermidine synthase
MVSRWKKWLSYLFELHVESAPSTHNPHLYVSLKQGRYQLSTANAIYSHEDLYTNFLQAFRRIRLDELPIEEVLVLGLGLGSVPYMLEHTLGKRYYYTAVEIDENVIDLANRYCLSQLDSPIITICADAYAFLLQNKQQYDLICMDIFLDDVVPPLFESPEFLEALRDSLTPQGLLLYNRLARTPEDRELSRAFFEGAFRQVFPEAACLDVSYNWMLLNRGEG